MDSHPGPPTSQVSPLASDQERDLAVEVLSQACSDGRLGLEDFSLRLESALSARTVGELAQLTVDLSSGPGALAAPARAGRGANWFIAVMASTVRRGRWHLRPSSRAVAVMGECVLDLRQVEVEARHSHILAVAVMGSIQVIVPEGIDVDLSGAAVMGSKDLLGGSTRPLPGSPSIHVTCCALMGEVQVRVRAPQETPLSDGRDPNLAVASQALRRHRHRRRFRDD
ncbi:MAG: DUF1707 SHOCT-like domain-containing protein [Candidatus Dormibacteria bacterium]|jgi:hypothetical protein